MAVQDQAPQPIANPGAAAPVIPPGADEFQELAAAVKAKVIARRAEYRELKENQPLRAKLRDWCLMRRVELLQNEIARRMKRVEFLQNEITRLRNKHMKANADHQICIQHLRLEKEADARQAQNRPRN
ncbi:hypothetical protein BV898_18916 [Hypsibius exemplaris]|uniref:Uncharacterized protein n=1 Tax=Hypsibius exemplaris TaxID=2072580 RepID=A0A9X6RPA6_HYPEX|nr:hypothetical protein BV898_18916 [Hypsibius exemplaris]